MENIKICSNVERCLAKALGIDATQIIPREVLPCEKSIIGIQHVAMILVSTVRAKIISFFVFYHCPRLCVHIGDKFLGGIVY